MRKRKISAPPEGCAELEIRTETSVCTGERLIGFYSPTEGKLLHAELVRSESDIDAFYSVYGRSR